MEIFIAWSGEYSGQIAEALTNWIPMVLQNIDPYFSPQDVGKGSAWTTELSGKLRRCKFGLLCMTPENVNNQWIMFEAGVLYFQIDNKVAPLLFGMSNSQLSGPLAMLQSVQFTETDFKRLFNQINNLQEFSISERHFDEVFSTWWPKLKAQLDRIIQVMNNDSAITLEPRSERDMISEILQWTRSYTYGLTQPVQLISYKEKKIEDITRENLELVKNRIKENYDAILEFIKGSNEEVTDIERRIFEQLDNSNDIRAAVGSEQNLKALIHQFVDIKIRGND